MLILPPSRRALLAALVASQPFAALAQTSLLDQGGKLLGQIPGARTTPGTSGTAAGLSTGEIGSGLKDALKIASQRVVGRVGHAGGYSTDPAIRVPLPGPLDRLRAPLQLVGASGMLDDLQLRMNHAAEQAAPRALDIFVDAISKLTISDSRAILGGQKDAATQYFRRTTSQALTTSFRPVVDSTLSGSGAATAFHTVQSKAATLPLAGAEVQSFNLTDFTVGKALDGLFHYLGVEEAAIRTNPAARTTDLLKKVFA